MRGADSMRFGLHSASAETLDGQKLGVDQDPSIQLPAPRLAAPALQRNENNSLGAVKLIVAWTGRFSD